MTDTIFALASASGRSAVAVFRISGPEARAVVEGLAGKVGSPRVASLRTLRNRERHPIDHGLVLWFPSPASYTGEDSAEVQIHGGVAVVDTLTETLLGLGARLAMPGEFTRRAFENGKLNLDEAEAVADLIDSETSAQARQAMMQLDGALGRRYEGWRTLLTNILSLLEASVDFPDEEVPPEIALTAKGSLIQLIDEINLGLVSETRGQRVREGYRVAIVGAPNAGKSSLLNSLAGRPAAIVMPTPGTTRDVVEVPLVLRGYKVVLADTAGVRTTKDEVEMEGVRRARDWAAHADLRLWVVDGSADDGSWGEASAIVKEGDICVVNKVDLPVRGDGANAARFAGENRLEVLRVSLIEGKSDSVVERLEKRVVTELGGSEFPAATRTRHAGHLKRAQGYLVRAATMLGDPELASEDVRLAARELSYITGRLGVEDVLDRVFSSFCIGK